MYFIFPKLFIWIYVVWHNHLVTFIGQLDTLEEAANEKEVTVCNHEIQIHEDLGHVCRVCGMIVREGLTQSLIISGERYVICLKYVMMLL